MASYTTSDNEKPSINGSIPNGKFSNVDDNENKVLKTENKNRKDKSSTFSTLLRILSFRKKPNKQNDTNKNKYQKTAGNSSESTIKTPSRSSSPVEDKFSSQNKSQTKANKDNPFSRLVRSFSFLYRRPKPKDDAFKRSKSQSISNFRHSSREDYSTKESTNETRKINSLRNFPKKNTKIFTSNVNNNDNSTDSVDVNRQKNLNQSRRHLVSAGLDTPGVSGIQNHGNTCFINSVIQCLSNTNTLAEYFIFDRYRVQTNNQKSAMINSLSRTDKNRTKRELVENFAILLQSIWSCMYSSEISFQFKKVISKYSDQYIGNDQHDAQEFLLWLLDKLNEELSSELYPDIFQQANNLKSTVNHKNELESLEDNRERRTVIHDLFQGNLCSVVVCPKCDYISKNFEPFLSLSLPVPIRLTFTINVNVIFQDNKNNPKKSGFYGISIHSESTMKELREQICKLIELPEKRVLILQLNNKIGMTEFNDDSCMIQELFEDFSTVYALETPEVKPTMNNALNEMCQQYLTIVWMNQVKYDRANCKSELFGPCFTAVVSREISYSGLKATIVRTMSEYLINPKEMQLEEFCHNFDITLKLFDSNSTSTEYFVALQNLDHPLFIEDVEDLLAKTEYNDNYHGPYHIKLIVEWDNDVRRSLLVSDDEITRIMDRKRLYVDKTVDEAKECSNPNSKVLLQDCLDTYFKEENLSADNAWMCPGCNTKQQCVKQLNIRTFPNILVIHLKRFRHRNKVNTMIDYPMNELDLSKYVTPHPFTNSSQNSVKVGQLIDVETTQVLQDESFKYNLYGVVCHHGTMQSGHYTAFCKNPVDSSWYGYDDIKVTPIKAQQVLANDSYILFYQKASFEQDSLNGNVNHCLMKNFQNYESLKQSNFNLNHWSFRMPEFTYYTSENYANRSKTLPNSRSKTSNNSSQNTKPIMNSYLKNSNTRTSGNTLTKAPINLNGTLGNSSNSNNGTALHPKSTKYDRSSSRLSDYEDKPVSNSLNTFPRSRSSQRI